MSAVPVRNPAFSIVPPGDVEKIWPLIVGGISDALATSFGEATPEDTLEGLKAGRTTLLLFEGERQWFGVVFLFLQFPQFKIARVLLAFGREMATMREEMAMAEAWAKQQGCRRVEAWVATDSRLRLFSRFGYRPKYTIIGKDLT